MDNKEQVLTDANAIIARHFADDPANAVRARQCVTEVLAKLPGMPADDWRWEFDALASEYGGACSMDARDGGNRRSDARIALEAHADRRILFTDANGKPMTEDQRAAVEYFTLNPSMADRALSRIKIWKDAPTDTTPTIRNPLIPASEADQEMERRGWVNVGYKHDVEKARRALSFCHIPGWPDGMSVENAIYALRAQRDEASKAAAVPVAEVLSSRAGNDTSTIDKALPTGTKLFAAPPSAPGAEPEKQAEQVKLYDSQWVNIVNHANCWADYSKEDAVHEAVKMTEAAIKANVTSASPAPSQESNLTAEGVERQYRDGVHIGSGLPRAACPCGFCAKHRYGFNQDGPIQQAAPAAEPVDGARPAHAAFETLKACIRADPAYAWTWHCNISASAHDEGLPTAAANRAAARFMHMAFSVDTSKHEHFAATQVVPSAEPQHEFFAEQRAARHRLMKAWGMEPPTAATADAQGDKRTAFEAWMVKEAKIIVGSTDPYPAGLERDYWRVWQAAWCAALSRQPSAAASAVNFPPKDVLRAACEWKSDALRRQNNWRSTDATVRDAAADENRADALIAAAKAALVVNSGGCGND